MGQKIRNRCWSTNIRYNIYQFIVMSIKALIQFVQIVCRQTSKTDKIVKHLFYIGF